MADGSTFGVRDSAPSTTDDKKPHPVDVLVGGRLRARRRFLGMSQTDLAKAVGLTFQQVQKYERGSNRISCSKLVDMAAVLKVAPRVFLDDMHNELQGDEMPGAGFMSTNYGPSFAAALMKVPAGQRRIVLDLVESMAATTTTGEG